MNVWIDSDDGVSSMEMQGYECVIKLGHDELAKWRVMSTSSKGRVIHREGLVTGMDGALVRGIGAEARSMAELHCQREGFETIQTHQRRQQ